MTWKASLFLITISLVTLTASAQNSNSTNTDRCGTMQLLEQRFKSNPELKIKFEQRRIEFNKAFREDKYKLANGASTLRGADTRTIYNIPIVFHIVLSNPNVVTDAQIQAQLNILNKNYLGSNEDSVKIPAAFKSLFGKSGIQFCLAERTPDGESTTGIERITTTQTSFGADNKVKYSSTRGANVWRSDKYFNVWICNLSNNVLGYSTFPSDGVVEEQGVVVDFRSLPGGSLTNYNTGKTVVHESGHFFNLFHIWGDDNGSCSGSDDVDDTPNQANSTLGCPTGIKTDNCTPSGNGIMYQNFMDYTDDACMVMFTKQQVSRMEAALVAFRPSLLNSNGCTSPVVKNFDVQLKTINQPEQRICTNSFTPAVTINNRGIQTLTSLNISTKIDDGVITTYNWTGSLAKSGSTNVTLNNLTTTTGNHSLTVYVSSPNNNQDEDATNDTITVAFQYYLPVTGVSESFEGATFPPPAWDIVNPDKSVTWKRITGVAKTGNASVMIDNFNYSATRNKDDLRMPNITIPNVDSAFLSFNVAAAAYTALNTPANDWDTLEVLMSTDCGQSYTSIYKKWGSSLVTRTTPATSFYVPAQNEWRKDSLNLAEYINRENILIAFRNTAGNENAIYLDDINLRTVTINPNLKSKGILVTPNPTDGVIAVQFYPPPANLKAIQVYSITGQKVAEVLVNGPAGNNYRLNISNFASGTYIVRVVFTDRVVTRKILKL
jgi:hypothetical protein